MELEDADLQSLILDAAQQAALGNIKMLQPPAVNPDEETPPNNYGK